MTPQVHNRPSSVSLVTRPKMMILINAITEHSLTSTTQEDDEEAGGMTKEERTQVIDDGYLADDEREEEEERKETTRGPERVCQKGHDGDGGNFGGEKRLPWNRTSRVLRSRGKCVPGIAGNLITDVIKLRIEKPLLHPPPPHPPSQPPPMKPKKRPAKNVPILVRTSNIPNRPIRC